MRRVAIAHRRGPLSFPVGRRRRGSRHAARTPNRGDGPDLLTQASSDFGQTLLAADLIDELRLQIYRVTLGTGKRLFRGGISSDVRMTSRARRHLPARIDRDGCRRVFAWRHEVLARRAIVLARDVGLAGRA
jgi:dihydrofolate reductase